MWSVRSRISFGIHSESAHTTTTNMKIIVDNNNKFIVIDEYREEFQ